MGERWRRRTALADGAEGEALDHAALDDQGDDQHGDHGDERAGHQQENRKLFQFCRKAMIVKAAVVGWAAPDWPDGMGHSPAAVAAASASAAADKVRAASSDPTRGCSAKARSAAAAEPVRAA